MSARIDATRASVTRDCHTAPAANTHRTMAAAMSSTRRVAGAGGEADDTSRSSTGRGRDLIGDPSSARPTFRRVLREFRAFVLRGNVVDLAVGVVIGTAFTAVVNALVSSMFTPLIAAIVGESDFS